MTKSGSKNKIGEKDEEGERRIGYKGGKI